MVGARVQLPPRSQTIPVIGKVLILVRVEEILECDNGMDSQSREEVTIEENCTLRIEQDPGRKDSALDLDCVDHCCVKMKSEGRRSGGNREEVMVKQVGLGGKSPLANHAAILWKIFLGTLQ
jgi:hypothetical protein